MQLPQDNQGLQHGSHGWDSSVLVLGWQRVQVQLREHQGLQAAASCTKAHPGLSQGTAEAKIYAFPPSAQQFHCTSHLAGENSTLVGQKVKKNPVSTFGRGKLPHNELLPLLPEMVDHVLCLHCELCAQGLQDLQLKAPAGLQAPEAAPCLGESRHSSGQHCPCQGKASSGTHPVPSAPCQGALLPAPAAELLSHTAFPAGQSCTP